MTSLAFHAPQMLQPVWEVGRQAIERYKRDRGSLVAAALAFYALLSVGPLVLIVTQFAGLFLGEGRAREALTENLAMAIGPAGASAVEHVTAELGEARYARVGIFGVVVALYAASRVFVSLQQALNQVWNVRPLPRDQLKAQARHLVWGRVRSALLVVSLGFLLLAVVLGTTVFSAVLAYLPQQFDHPVIWRIVQLCVSFGLSSVIFAVIYRVVPDARVSWAHVWPGAWLAGALFALGKFGMTWYVGTHAVRSLSDTTASLLIVLLWAAYSANVFLLGAEVAEAVAERDGSGVQPLPHATIVMRGPEG
jgi:membrane protein